MAFARCRCGFVKKNVPDKLIGRKAKCPKCGESILIKKNQPAKKTIQKKNAAKEKVSNASCPKCGFVRKSGDVSCPKCSAIYAKVEAKIKKDDYEKFLKKKKEESELEVKRLMADSNGNQSNNKKHNKVVTQLDCSACKSNNSMTSTSIPKFNTILRVIGYIIVAPSIFGLIISVILFISTLMATSEVLPTANSDAAKAGAAIGASIGFGFAFSLACGSLVSGLIGWILLMKKKVYKCVNCGFVLDRA